MEVTTGTVAAEDAPRRRQGDASRAWHQGGRRLAHRMSGHRDLYHIEGVPLFQNVTYDTPSEARTCAVGDVILAEDRATGLVGNRLFRPESIVFDARYQNEQALSTAFRAHLAAVADIVVGAFGGEPVVEIGCGKATFLAMLADRGVTVSGFDPAYEGSNPVIRRALFTGAERLAAGGIVLRHVLEHIADPLAFLAGIAAANGGAGKVYIEVPCLDWIIARRAWFDIFYEHVNYFRLADFHRMFGRVHEAGHLFGGQYIYVVADLASLRTPRRSEAEAVAFPDDFDAARDAALAVARGAVVWGGASKGVIFSLMAMRRNVPVAAVIDINPAKQGRFLPVTGLAVLPPEQGLAFARPDAPVLVMNGNYLAEIAAVVGTRAPTVAADAVRAAAPASPQTLALSG